MSKKISFKDANGATISGKLEVSGGIFTVTALDGRTKAAKYEEGTLSGETLARMLLLQLHQEGRPSVADALASTRHDRP
jgi:hypothetical protein